MGRLHHATRVGKYDEVVECLVQGADLDALSVHHASALMIASQEGHLSIVKLLLKAGAAVGIAGRHQRTALHYAAIKGHLAVVQALVAKGADVNAQSSAGFTPAMEAAQFNLREVALFLLEHGTDPNFKNRDGQTAADWLAEGGIQGRCARNFPDKLRNSPQARANASRNVRRLMAEGLSADEYAAKHGRRMLVWSYGHYQFEDADAQRWAHRVAEILFTPGLLEQCEEQTLQGEELEDARKCRARRAKSAARYAKKSAGTAT
jgi:ankyrin repeat protein